MGRPEGYFSLLRIYNALVQSTNPFIPSFPLHLKTSFFTTTVTILVLIKKRGGKKRGRKKPRGLIKWRQQCSPSVSPGIFYHEGYRNSHNQRLLSRVNSKLPLASTILFRHIPLTVYPNFIAFAAVSSGVNSKKNSTQWYLKFRYVSCSRSLIFKIFVSRAFTRRVLYRIKGSIFAFNTVASLYLCGSIMVGQARERNFNGPGIYLWVRGNGSPRNNATRRERERGEEKRKKEWERIDDPCEWIVLSRAMTNFGKREGKKKNTRRGCSLARERLVWHRAFYNAETRKGQLRARLSSNHLTFFSESRLPRASLPFSSLEQLLR